MEDTKSLLKIVLQKIFHDQLQTVEDTYKIIYSYNNGKKKRNDYEKTLRNICELMEGKLPPRILVYLLTLVDIPLDEGRQLPIIEKMQKTQSCLPESVRPQLLEILNRKRPNNTTQNVQISSDIDSISVVQEEIELGQKSSEKTSPNKQQKSPKCNNFVKPPEKRRNRRKTTKSYVTDNSDENIERVQSLLDLSANYVIKHEKKLKHFHNKKFEKAWTMINSNLYGGRPLQQCYDTVKDLNRKRKLLRGIENDDITEELVSDLYQDTDIFLREKHLYHVLKNDPFNISRELRIAMSK